MGQTIAKQQGGEVRCEAINVQQLLDDEQVTIPAHLRTNTNPDMGDDHLPISIYTSREHFDLEIERVWPRVWQMVCRQEDIPEPGDVHVYDNLNESLLITRQADGSIKAFVNSCLHRGRALRAVDGRVRAFRCPFHGFQWNIDGSFSHMPCEWDFQHVCKDAMQLPEVKCDTWGGFVFINIDGEAKPLLEYLGVIPEHFERYGLEQAFKGVHVQKMIPCNWKVAHEAFLESYHAIATHPQILPFTADANTQYDTFGDHVSRMITAMEVSSPHLKDMTEHDIVSASLKYSGRMADHGDKDIEMPEGMTARQYIGEMNRQAFAEASNRDLSDATLSELQDAILYDIFPNTQVWAGYFGNIVYQFRPNGLDHETCIFDVRMLLRSPEADAPPRGVPVHRLSDEEPFTAAEELGALGEVFDQDMRNLPYMMKGLKASKVGSVTLGSYQESRIRHLHATIKKYFENDENLTYR
ncbi:MAG: aromatic ring-hydroxylating dioxygenase subunit alpha [Pseudomonadota bacterium]